MRIFYRSILQRYVLSVLFPKFNSGNIAIRLCLQLHASVAQSFFCPGNRKIILHVPRNSYLCKQKQTKEPVSIVRRLLQYRQLLATFPAIFGVIMELFVVF